MLGVAIIVVVLAGSGGVVFACGGGGGGCGNPTGDSCSSDLEVIWHTPSATAPSSPAVGCKLSLTTSTLTVTVTGLSPGASCGVSALLENIGNVDATLSESVSLAHSGTCTYFHYSDNTPSSPAVALDADHSRAFAGSISLLAAGGDTCEGATATVHVTITATGSSSCDGEPSGSGILLAVPDWTC